MAYNAQGCRVQWNSAEDIDAETSPVPWPGTPSRKKINGSEAP